MPGRILSLQFYVQLTEQDLEVGYANISGMVFASFRSQDGKTSMVARTYNSSQQVMQWPALEVNIALASNQSAWISSAGGSQHSQVPAPSLHQTQGHRPATANSQALAGTNWQC